AEGIERGADTLMLADDHRFVAITPGRKHVVDNSRATALGFVTALELMRGGLAGESVLVLGCGPVGLAAGRTLLDRGASVVLCDSDEVRARAAHQAFGQNTPDSVRVVCTASVTLEGYELIFDATDAGGFIEAAHLTPRTMVAAPGLPCALTPDALAEHRDRILHDALEIGTATMAVQSAAELAGGSAIKKAGEG
ncbi:hypothetical protein ACFL3Z_00580, partial [Gemmatimonadota bacterium]